MQFDSLIDEYVAGTQLLRQTVKGMSQEQLVRTDPGQMVYAGSHLPLG